MIKYLIIWIVTGLFVGYVVGRKQGGSLRPYILSGLFLGLLSPVLFWINFIETNRFGSHSSNLLDPEYDSGLGLPSDPCCPKCGYPPDAGNKCRNCGYSCSMT